MIDDYNRLIPKYNDDSDYNTNAPTYYDDLARKHKLIELLAKKIWEYEEKLDLTLEDIESRVQQRFSQWDGRIESFPDNVETLLQGWLSDGKLDHIINETIFSWKADQVELDKTNTQLVANTSAILNRSKHPFVEYLLERPSIMAHRGLYKILPENTIAAFYACWRMGVKLFETDIRKTVDGHFVVLHDPSTLRTTGVDKVVSESTLVELRELNQSKLTNASLYGNPKIPTIEELFEFIKQTGSFVNVNFDYGIAQSDVPHILDLIYIYGIKDNVLLQGDYFRDADKDICVSYDVPLTDEAYAEANLKGNVITARDFGYAADVNSVNLAMKLGNKYRIPLIIYTVDNYENFTKLDKTGVSSMMINYYWQRKDAIK